MYYTDVIQLGDVWNGWFLSFFPIAVKILDALTFVVMGVIVDRCRFRQGKARPWILMSAPLLVVSMILLFAVPSGSEWMLVIWIFFSYNLFYSVAYTAYNTIYTLTTGLAMCVINLGITQFGYRAPGLDGTIPVQTPLVQSFFVFCAIGVQVLIYPVVAAVLMHSPDDRKRQK